MTETMAGQRLRSVHLAVAAVLFLLVAGAAAGADDQYYYYQDSQGKNHLAVSLDDVPEAFREQAIIVDGKGNKIGGPANATGRDGRYRPKSWAATMSPLEWDLVKKSSNQLGGVLFIEFWRSRLFYGTVLLLLLSIFFVGSFLHARRLADRRDLILYVLANTLAGAAAFVMVWLTLVGPESKRFLDGVSQGAVSASEQADPRARDRLERVQKLAVELGVKLEPITPLSD